MSKIPIRAAEHPEHVWEAQRQLFTRLYKEEKMKLPEVQRLMQKEHGFYATERQYKRRIKKWRLEKNSKANEKHQALISLKVSEARLDLTCTYKLNGKGIAAHKLLRYARSRGVESPNIVCKTMDRKCRFSLNLIERITRSQDLALNHRSGRIEIFLHNLGVVLDRSDHFILSRTGNFLNQILFVQFLFSPLMKSGEQPLALFADKQPFANQLLLFVSSSIHLKTQKEPCIGREWSILMFSAFLFAIAYGELACQHLSPSEKVNTNKTWEESFGISVDKIEVLHPELFSRLIKSFTAHAEVCASMLKEMAESRRRWLSELPRVIEDLEESPDDQQQVQSEALAIEMQDIDYTDTSNTIPRGFQIIQSFEISANTGRAENGCSDSDIRFHSHLSVGDVPSNRFEAVEFAPRSSSHGAPELETNEPSQIKDNIASMDIDSYAFGLADPSLAGVSPSPPFPSILTMELLSPLVLPDEYMHLAWRTYDSSEIPAGSIPDLETFLDSSLWEDSRDMAQLDQNSVPPLEVVEGGTTSLPTAEVQRRLQ